MLVVCTTTAQAPTVLTYLGVTLTFGSEIVSGTFATDGSPWFIGPVAFPTISHAGVTGRHGAMINPSQKALQGYDSRVTGYDATLNVKANPPATITAGQTLIAAISLNPGAGTIGSGGSVTAIDVMAVFTCLASPPAAGAYRPPYSGTDKTMRNRSEVNHALSPLLTKPTGPITSLPTLDMTTIVKYPLYDVGIRSNMRSKLRPQTNFGGEVYPAYAFNQLANASAYSLLNIADANEVRHRIVQHGIDYFANCVFADDMYSNGAGFGANGALFCIIFAGYFLGDAPMLAAGTRTTVGGYPAHGEQYQFYYDLDGWTGYILPKPYASYASGIPLFGDADDDGGPSLGTNWSERNLSTQDLAIADLSQPGVMDAHKQSYTDSDYYPSYPLFRGATAYTGSSAGAYMYTANQGHAGMLFVVRKLGITSYFHADATFDYLERLVNDPHNLASQQGLSNSSIYVFGGASGTNLRNFLMNMYLNYHGTRGVLSVQSAVATGPTTADITVTTNLGAGKLKAVASTSSTKPNGHQINVHQNAANTIVPFASSAALTTTGAKTFAITGLTTGVPVFIHITQYGEDASIASVVTTNAVTPS